MPLSIGSSRLFCIVSGRRLLCSLATVFLLLFGCLPVGAQNRDVEAHDPVIGKEGDTYYLFCTGRGIRVEVSQRT